MQVPPTPESSTAQVQPSATHGAWLLMVVLVHVLQTSGVPRQLPGPVMSVQPWQSVLPHDEVGHDEQLV